MLDVHPAHHAASTWRDFFIHIATIVIGLLIAVGLEQTVEAVHHRHQRQELIEEIHRDCKVNRQYIEDDITAAEHVMDWARAQASAIDRASPTESLILRRMPSGKIGRPDAGVWPTAKANGQASLLSTGEQNWFDDIDLVHNQLFVSSNSSTANLYVAFQALDEGMLGRATDTPSGDLDLSRLNAAQRAAVVEDLRSIDGQARNVLQNLVSYLNDIEYVLHTPGDQLDAPEGLKDYLEIARKNAMAHPGIRYNFISN